MIGRVIAWSARHPRVVLATALAAALTGEAARRSLARDVIPDLSDPQIVLVTEWMGHSAPEVASSVTEVLTGALQGVSGSTAIRGSSMAGMSYVDVVFRSVSALSLGRSEIVARVEKAQDRLPRAARTLVGPEASSTGWVFQYALVAPSLSKNMHARVEPFSRLSLLSLRRFQDDVLRPALMRLPGVAEIASVGGEVEELLIEARPDGLRAAGLALSDLVLAVQGALQAHRDPTVEQVQSTPIIVEPGGRHAPPRLIKDVARVRRAAEMANGVADFGGYAQVVGGIVIARRDADPAAVIDHVKQALESARAGLPKGAELIVVYDRSELAKRVERTLLRALAEEVAVVVIVVLMFLLHGRSALLPLTTLPVVVLLTFTAMWLLGIPATVMSLGGIGIALGMAVDADIVALEACHCRLEQASGTSSKGETRRAEILAAAGSFAPAILISLIIAALSFVPVFAFSGETGRLLRPLALTKTLVIGAAGVVALTLAPALRDRLLRGPVMAEFSNPLTRGLVHLYRPFVHFALTRPVFTLATAGLAAISCLPIAARLGGEFLPPVDEGDLLFMPTTSPGVLPEQAAMQLARQDRAISAAGEVATVFGKVGRADTATDPAPFSMAETIVSLRPREAWPKLARARWYSGWAPDVMKPAFRLLWPDETPATMAELVQALDRATELPGWTNAWTAPARARLDMMSTGVRTPVGVRIVVSDPGRLDLLGAALRKRLLGMQGTRSAVYESLGGETRLQFVPDPAALARHHADQKLVRSVADLVRTGGQVAQIERGGHSLRVRIATDLIPPRPEDVRRPEDLMREATVRVSPSNDSGKDSQRVVPLALLGHPEYVEGPAILRAERGELVGYIYVDLTDGRDLLAYVERAQRELANAMATNDPLLGLHLLPGERIEWTGQYELLAAGQRRLKIIAPIVALLMLGLLFLQFRSLIEAFIVLVSVPFALVGSFWTLYLFGYRLSAPVWVGLLSVVGLAMQTGVVMVVYIDEAFHRRLRAGTLRNRDDIVAAHAEGTVRRLRPKIMTITTMSAGLLPLLWSQGAGSEIMRRVAAPMVGGLVTSAFLTLEVIPVLYTVWRYRQLKKAERTGISLQTLVGRIPSWARG